MGNILNHFKYYFVTFNKYIRNKVYDNNMYDGNYKLMKNIFIKLLIE